MKKLQSYSQPSAQKLEEVKPAELIKIPSLAKNSLLSASNMEDNEDKDQQEESYSIQQGDDEDRTKKALRDIENATDSPAVVKPNIVEQEEESLQQVSMQIARISRNVEVIE